MGESLSVVIRAAGVIVLFSSVTATAGFAQIPSVLTISPDKATMLVGETHTFRAVGKDGRMRHNVRWRISPEHAAELRVNGDEVVVAAREASTGVLLTAFAEGDSADASIEIRSAGDMAAGTILWQVSPTPGCKAAKMTQAVPSANGPDLYVQESCPEGIMIRALTADGRELWRRLTGGGSQAPASGADPISKGPYIGFLPNGVTSSMPASKTSGKTDEPAGEHIHPQAASVCDAISVGMPREDAFKTVAERKLGFDARQKSSDTWTIEEEGFRCTISFDGTKATVVKKKKTVVTD
jgi:hypothetical protein